VVIVPLALYAAWIVWVRLEYVPAHGEIQNFHISNILLIPNFIADEASSVAGAVAGLNYNFEPQSLYWIFSTDSPYGPVLAASAAVALGLRLYRGSRPALLWGLMAILLAFWISLALGFDVRIGRNPVTARYVYAGAILTLLVGAEAARGVRLSRGGLVALYAITVLALGANVARLRDGANFYRSFTTSLRAQLTGIELARDRVDPAFRAATPTSYLAPVRAGPYLAAVDRNGSPAYSPAELARQPENKRHDADAVVVAALRIALAPTVPGGSVRHCRRVAGGSSVTLPVGPPGVRLSAPAGAGIALRRFASTATEPVGNLSPGRMVDLRIPPDRSQRTWQAVVTPAPKGVTVCALPAGT
jgi:hypothetical protein